MLLDATTRVTGATPQAITATAVSVNSLDLGGAGRDIGPGEMVPFQVRTVAAFATGTSLTVDIVSSAVTALTSPTVHVSSGAILTAALTANKVIMEGVIPRGVALQHLGARFTVAGSNYTTGSLIVDFGVNGPQSSFTGGPV